MTVCEEAPSRSAPREKHVSWGRVLVPFQPPRFPAAAHHDWDPSVICAMGLGSPVLCLAQVLPQRGAAVSIVGCGPG